MQTANSECDSNKPTYLHNATSHGCVTTNISAFFLFVFHGCACLYILTIVKLRADWIASNQLKWQVHRKWRLFFLPCSVQKLDDRLRNLNTYFRKLCHNECMRRRAEGAWKWVVDRECERREAKPKVGQMVRISFTYIAINRIIVLNHVIWIIQCVLIWRRQISINRLTKKFHERNELKIC